MKCCASALALALFLFLSGPIFAFENDRPNILWLSTEDIGPQLACYGDATAKTPNLDVFAKRSLVYNVAWSNYPVCAPARTTIITGMYAASNGAGNMRSHIRLSHEIKMFPTLMKQAGYYCTNKTKTDYNHPFKMDDVWDASSGKAHWKNRPEGKPFFAVVNHTGTHESKIRNRPHDAVVDPARVKLPPYWPDRPEVRQDWAQYYDNIQTMDGWFGNQLKELEKAGLADDTIVVFFGDHGSGMPRHKRFAGDSGQRVPFIIHVPEKFKHLAPDHYSAGGKTDDMIGFVDLAPTMLSLAGVEPPEWMQGRAVMGKFKKPAPRFLYGFRDRMDERPDLSRAVRDQKYIYVRNFMPNLPAGQELNYQMQTPTTAVWHQMFVDGKLNEVQSQFWKRHPPEELYDLENDPHETKSLAGDPKYKDQLERFRTALRDHTIRIKDLGFLPEAFIADVNQSNVSLREFASKEKGYPIACIFEIANQSASSDPGAITKLVEAASSGESVFRYWAAIGFLNRPEESMKSQKASVMKLMNDPVAAVAVVAAELVAKQGNGKDRDKALNVLIDKANLNDSDFFTALNALNAIDRLGEIADPILDKIKDLPTKDPSMSRGGDYVERMVKALMEKK